jgi:hypothetical protein
VSDQDMPELSESQELGTVAEPAAVEPAAYAESGQAPPGESAPEPVHPEHEGSGHESGGHEEHEGEEEEEEDDENVPLRHALRKRLIRLEGMDPAMKILIAVGLTQLLVAALLLALRNVSMPSIIGDQTSDTDVSDIPDIAFVIAMLGFCGAWSLLLAGAYRGGWLIRALFIAGFGWGFWEVRDVVSGEGAFPPLMCAILLGLAIVLGIVTYFPERKFRAAGAKADQPVSKFLHRLRIATPITLFLLIGGTCLVAFLEALSYDHANGIPHGDFGSAVTGFTTNFSYLLYNHQYVLIPILVLAGSEFGEWGDFVVRRVAQRVQRPAKEWLLPLVALMAAGAMLWDGLRTAADPDVGGGIQAELILGVVLLASIALVGYLAKPSGGWSPKVPFLAVAFVAFADTISGFIAVDRINAADPLIDEKIYAVSALLWMGLGAVSLIVLAARRGKLSGAWVNSLIFVMLVGATEGLQAIPYVGIVVHPLGLSSSIDSSGDIITNGSYFGLEGIRSIFALLTIALVIGAIAARKLKEWRTPIVISLVLLGGLQVLTWIDSLFGKATNVTGTTAIAAGAVLVIAIMWEFLSSGEAVTNHHDSRFTRSTRIYVYLGYVLLVAISVLYYSDLHVHGTHNVIESQFDSEEWVREGILFLGVPLVIGMALARLQRWRMRPEGTGAEAAVDELTPTEGATAGHVAGAGTLEPEPA